MFLITSKSSSSLVLDSSESTDFLETFEEFSTPDIARSFSDVR
jgi:hypothetical protein